MKRPDRFQTTVCPTCYRDGWTRRVHRSLLTEEEAGYEVKIKGLPERYTPMSATCGSNIYAAVKEGIEFCQMYKVDGVGFDFNEKLVLVTATSNADGVTRNWWKQLYGETPEESFAKR